MVKQMMSLPFFTLMLLFVEPSDSASLKIYLMLAISGIIGIGMGDYYWFCSVKEVGPRITLLFELLTPLVTFLINMAFAPALSLYKWLGMFVTIFGLYVVMDEQERRAS